MGITTSTSLLKKLQKKDKVREYKKEYNQRKDIKRKWMQEFIAQIKKGIQEEQSNKVRITEVGGNSSRKGCAQSCKQVTAEQSKSKQKLTQE